MKQQPAPNDGEGGGDGRRGAAQAAEPPAASSNPSLQALERLVAQAGPAHQWTEVKEQDKMKKGKGK